MFNTAKHCCLNEVGNSLLDCIPWLFFNLFAYLVAFSNLLFFILIYSFIQKFLRDYLYSNFLTGSGNSVKSKIGQNSCPLGA